MIEVNRREKEGGIIPDPDVDTFMKVKFYSLLLVDKKPLI
jgi:hypothetical protein